MERIPLYDRDLIGKTITFAEALGWLVGVDTDGDFYAFYRMDPVESVPDLVEQPSPPEPEVRRRMQGRKNPDWLAEARALRGDGYSWDEIGTQIGVSGNTARRWVLLTGALPEDKPRQGRRWHTAAQMAAREAHVAEAKRLRETGCTYRQIGKAMGVNEGTAHRWANGG